ncbi:putative phage protein gp47/JayE [Paucimonas lemoignei]|uniref:Putative phage protein gp47/JayE n=1 Tax=Paucimonas lemoignei TaxID=29443 RepID=A0A4R3HXE6_PAULE|nr:baseplate J/gp47 family protein [Paucimonas lemoignei]TCS37494.1 putative phage protein gp47/JayE [Paucimonas lemoignei]
MPFTRPELIDLRDAAYADIERIPGADARLAFGNLNVLAHIVAGAVDGLYGYLDWQSRQLLPDTADAEVLDRHASIWSVTRRPAEPASGDVTVSGAIGTVVPAGTLFVRTDGQQFASTVEVVLAGATAAVNVQAAVAGVLSNTAAGSAMTLVSPVPGLASAATVAAGGLVNGSDVETDAALRARLLKRVQSPPDGGSMTDYEQWALEVPGVTRAWVYPLELGPGTVTVRFVRDGDVSLIPDAGEVAAVQSYIDALRPVTSALTVVAPVASPINFQIQLTPGSAAVKAAVESELRDLIKREAAPGKTLLVSHIREAISIAVGEEDHVLIAPAANVVNAVGQIATFGGIVWS